MNMRAENDPSQRAFEALDTLRAEIAKLLLGGPAALARGAKLDFLVKRYQQIALAACEGSVPGTATLLGVHRRTLERNLRKKKPRARARKK
jgi:hypothetical protein